MSRLPVSPQRQPRQYLRLLKSRLRKRLYLQQRRLLLRKNSNRKRSPGSRPRSSPRGGLAVPLPDCPPAPTGPRHEQPIVPTLYTDFIESPPTPPPCGPFGTRTPGAKPAMSRQAPTDARPPGRRTARSSRRRLIREVRVWNAARPSIKPLTGGGAFTSQRPGPPAAVDSVSPHWPAQQLGAFE